MTKLRTEQEVWMDGRADSIARTICLPPPIFYFFGVGDGCGGNGGIKNQTLIIHTLSTFQQVYF